MPQCLYESTSSLPNVIKIPKFILSRPSSQTGDVNVDTKCEEALLKPWKPRHEVCSRANELSDTLASLKTWHVRRTSFTSSSSSPFDTLPLPRECCTVPRLRYEATSTSRIMEWRRELELAYPSEVLPRTTDCLRSFLPSCYSSGSSSTSSSEELDMCQVTPTGAKHAPLYQTRSSATFNHNIGFNSYDLDDVESCAVSSVGSDEENMWPYDGKGLYEHHSESECGEACFVSCRQRRRSRPSRSRFSMLGGFIPWLRRGMDGQTMTNSNVPHPPWTLEYRSNDDSLAEDHDDGDLEVWLEHVTQKQKLNHQLRFKLRLDDRPDSRIFSF